MKFKMIDKFSLEREQRAPATEQGEAGSAPIPGRSFHTIDNEK